MSNDVNFSSLQRLLGLNNSTETTTSSSTSNSSDQSVNFNEEYKTSLADLKAMYDNGTITKSEYKQLKQELEADRKYKQNVFDTNNDKYLTGYEADLYSEFVSAAASGSDVNIYEKYSENRQEIYEMYNQGIISSSEYSELMSECDKEYRNNRNLDTNYDGVLSAQEAAVGEFKEKVALYKKMDKDGDMVFNENEQAALDAYNEAVANPDTSFTDVSIKDFVQTCSTATEKIAMYKELKQFDIDGDGKFNYAEYQSMEAYYNPPVVIDDPVDESEPTEESVPVDETVPVDESEPTEEPELTTKPSGFDLDVSIDASTMQRFDYNGDGTYDSSELEALQAYIKSEQDAKIDLKIDVDADGQVEKSEIAAMRAYVEAEKAKGNYSSTIQKIEARLNELDMNMEIPIMEDFPTIINDDIPATLAEAEAETTETTATTEEEPVTQKSEPASEVVLESDADSTVTHRGARLHRLFGHHRQQVFKQID